MPFSIAFVSEKGYAVDISSTQQYAGRRGKVDLFQGTLGSKDIRRASATLGKSGSLGERLKKKINAYVGLEIARNFAEGKDSNGRKWERLKESTIRKKTKVSAQGTRTVLRQFTSSQEDSDSITNTRKRLDQAKINIQSVGSGSRFAVPLAETGNLFKSVTTPVTRTQGRASTLSQIVAGQGGGVGLVISERQKFVNFSPTPLGKNWDVKFGVHNKPVGESTTTGKALVPGREFFYISDPVKEFTVLLIGMARLVGTKQLKQGVSETTGERSPFFVKASRDFRPRTKSRKTGGVYSGKRGRTPGRGGRVEFTLDDFVHWAKNGSRKFNAKYLGISKTMEDDPTTIADYFSRETEKLLNDSRIFAFTKAVDAVSAARAVGERNRGKGNKSVERLVG